MIYVITQSANEIENFRYRFEEGQVVLYEELKTSFTYLNKETNLLMNVIVPMKENIEDYLKLAQQTIEAQKVYFTGPVENDSYQFSAIPWIRFTHISHTESGKKDQAVPMFDWGKFYDIGNKKMMPFSIQAHHSFVDGVHMGMLAEVLQKRLNEIE